MDPMGYTPENYHDKMENQPFEDVSPAKNGLYIYIGISYIYIVVSKNSGTTKSSIIIGLSLINHPFWGPTPIFGNSHIVII